ncbi:MAG: 50S ribosomal protein L28 [Patescibacteria group bacterium]
MSKICLFCSKTRATGNNVSHSNRKTRRVFNPNLQVVSVVRDGQKIQLKACTKCIKTMGKKLK